MLLYGAFTGASLLRRDPPDRYVAGPAMLRRPTLSCYLVKVRRALHGRAVSALGSLFRSVGFDLGDIGGNSAFRFYRVIGILQPQKVAFRQAEEFA
jgi:hypothetical protein